MPGQAFRDARSSDRRRPFFPRDDNSTACTEFLPNCSSPRADALSRDSIRFLFSGNAPRSAVTAATIDSCTFLFRTFGIPMKIPWIRRGGDGARYASIVDFSFQRYVFIELSLERWNRIRRVNSCRICTIWPIDLALILFPWKLLIRG